MRHSTHLKGKDYRDLLEIIDLTYGANCPDALFPPLYEKLARAIGCSGALYLATGAGPGPKARGAIMFEHSLQLAREYADYYWTLDPLCITGGIRKSNRATRVSDLVPYSSFATLALDNLSQRAPAQRPPTSDRIGLAAKTRQTPTSYWIDSLSRGALRANPFARTGIVTA